MVPPLSAAGGWGFRTGHYRLREIWKHPTFRPGVSYVFGFRLVLEIPLDTKARVAHETLVAGEVV